MCIRIKTSIGAPSRSLKYTDVVSNRIIAFAEPALPAKKGLPCRHRVDVFLQNQPRRWPVASFLFLFLSTLASFSLTVTVITSHYSFRRSSFRHLHVFFSTSFSLSLPEFSPVCLRRQRKSSSYLHHLLLPTKSFNSVSSSPRIRE
ncbi:hypothetical protein HN51_056353 [Arachis hypogaea]